MIAITDWASGHVVQTWRGHRRGVHCVVGLRPFDGVLSGSRDATAHVWRRGNPQPEATLAGHELTVAAVAAADNGRVAMTGSRDSSVRVWDLSTAACTGRAHVSRNVVTCLSWVADEPTLVAQGSEDLRLRLWDVRALSRPASVIEGYTYFPLCVDCAGHLVLTGSNGFDGTGCELRLWDRRTLKQVHEMRGHKQAVTGCALLRSQAGAGWSSLRAVSGSKDGEVRLWDASTGQAHVQPLWLSSGGVTGMAAATPEAAPPNGGEAHALATTTNGEVHVLCERADGTGLDHVAVATAAPSHD